MSLYLDIFLEAAHTASLVPLASEPTFFAMYGFGYNIQLAAVVAILGASLGAGFNFVLGVFLRRLYHKKNATHLLSEKQYSRAKNFFSRFGFVFLLFSWLPLLNFTVFAAGFLAMRPRIAMSLVVIGLTTRYGYYIL